MIEGKNGIFKTAVLKPAGKQIRTVKEGGFTPFIVRFKDFSKHVLFQGVYFIAVRQHLRVRIKVDKIKIPSD